MDQNPYQAPKRLSSGKSLRPAPWKKLAVLVTVVVLFVIALTMFREKLSLEYLATQESALQDFRRNHPFLVYGLAVGIYVGVTGLSLPGALALTLLYGWFFGVVEGVILVSFSSTTGATLAFLLSRYLLGDTIQSQFGDKLGSFNRALEREGPFYLFTLRLIPAVPFFVINVVMGLTPIRTSTFWWVSQLGMLPGTAVYVYAGSAVPSLAELAQRGAKGILSPQILLALVLLGLFPLVVRHLMKRFKPDSVAGASDL